MGEDGDDEDGRDAERRATDSDADGPSSGRVKLAAHDPFEGANDEERERVLDALMADYQTASEDARYRDRLLTQMFYLALVLGSLLLNGAITVVLDFQSEGQVLLSLSAISGAGAVSFGLLFVFARNLQESRNSAWARRKEIEEYVDAEHGGAVATNRSIANSLRLADFEYENDEDGGVGLPDPLSVSASGVLCLFLKYVTAGLVLAFVVSLGLIVRFLLTLL